MKMSFYSVIVINVEADVIVEGLILQIFTTSIIVAVVIFAIAIEVVVIV